MSHMWTQAEAIELCRMVEQIAPNFGCHVALTGGLLYKDGERKDCDLLFYRIRQSKIIDKEGLFNRLQAIGLCELSGSGWIHKGAVGRKCVDMFFPEEDGAPKERTDYQ